MGINKKSMFVFYFNWIIIFKFLIFILSYLSLYHICDNNNYVNTFVE